jgi:hypothetical protein
MKPKMKMTEDACMNAPSSLGEAYIQTLRTTIGPFERSHLALHLNIPNVIRQFSKDYLILC